MPFLIHLVVAYDIVEDNRRNRLAKKLKGFLQRVQFSVFEGEISLKRLEIMKRVIAKEINSEEDSVRIYHLCRRCSPAIEILGVGVYVESPNQDLFF